MTDFYVRLLTSEKADWLQQEYPNAFLLLSYIVRHCRRTNNNSDGMLFGDCPIGVKETPKKAGLTPKQFRNAREKLVEFKILDIVYHPQPKSKPKKGKSDPGIIFEQKRATKRATKSMIVNVCNSDIYDISFEYEGNQMGNERATKGQPKGNKQKDKQKEETYQKEQQQTPAPLNPSPVVCSVGLFPCLIGLFVSDSDKQRLANEFQEIDLIRAIAVLNEQKTKPDNVMGFIINALKNKWVPKRNPKIQLSDKAERNKKNLFEYTSSIAELLNIKGLEVKDMIDHALFGNLKIYYEADDFNKQVGSARKYFNLLTPQEMQNTNLKQIINGETTHSNIVNIASLGKNLVDNLSENDF